MIQGFLSFLFSFFFIQSYRWSSAYLHTAPPLSTIQDRDCLFSLQSSVFVFTYSYYYTDPRRDARPQAIRYCTYILLLALCPRACACVCRVVWIQPALRTFSDSDSDDTYSRNRQSNRTTCNTNAPTGSCASSRFYLDYHQRECRCTTTRMLSVHQEVLLSRP